MRPRLSYRRQTRKNNKEKSLIIQNSKTKLIAIKEWRLNWIQKSNEIKYLGMKLRKKIKKRIKKNRNQKNKDQTEYKN